MKKHSFRLFAAVWAVMFAVFNLASFVIPPVAGENKYEGSFWFGWALVCVAFLIDLGCGVFTFRANNLQKMFYRLPLVDLGYWATAIITAVGSVIMIVNTIPQWVAGVISFGIIVIYFIAIAKTATAAFIVEEIDEKVKTGTLFIKSLTVDAEGLIAKAKSEDVKAECKKVYEAVRYSDPMSNDALAATESQITLKFSELSAAVGENNLEAVKTAAREVVVLLDDRNKKCKLLK